MKLEQAQSLLNFAQQYAVENGLEISAAITDCHGELIAFFKMDKSSLQSARLAQNKAYTAARDRQPSASLGKWAQETGKDMGYWTDARFTGLGGGLPIEHQGTVIGAVGISGLSETDDEALARLAISHVFAA
ncbi:GlcG/HbpS family heme-binding protein [Vibrio methylphosphonaticus]|uniref:GlcG/HbpS family heme-binding protein n=1 Tax=Vibrio methylphosphonaticus TaxID=2946866 RepID=UPI002029FC25|nr:heme-binding protein [Vibrio methylphosphonaticus]MCL9776214.1 heme-binding protein [Vibrio methylphosphonaticus]